MKPQIEKHDATGLTRLESIGCLMVILLLIIGTGTVIYGIIQLIKLIF